MARTALNAIVDAVAYAGISSQPSSVAPNYARPACRVARKHRTVLGHDFAA
jgi:hypothetical protein